MSCSNSKTVEPHSNKPTMHSNGQLIDIDGVFHHARLSRDRRFDGLFFVAVVTTGIYCRSICPAKPAQEANVYYFSHGAAASRAGFRPCLRCRPDASPGSQAWVGSSGLLKQAIDLSLQISPQTGLFYSITEIASRLAISSRYLRQLCQQHMGLPLKQYRLHQQLLMAKQLLQSSHLPIEDIAGYCGFNSLRSFNSACRLKLGVAPSHMRRGKSSDNTIQFVISYRPPYNWRYVHQFLVKRCIDGMASSQRPHQYLTTLELENIKGLLEINHQGEHCRFTIRFWPHPLSKQVDVLGLNRLVRQMLDTDADSELIDQHISQVLPDTGLSGLRLVTTTSPFEAICRAILGQQVTLSFGIKLTHMLVHRLGETWSFQHNTYYFFPRPEVIAHSDLSFLPIPRSRQHTLLNIAQLWCDVINPQESDWLGIKGIGPWTCDYVRMRGLGSTDRLLLGDAVVKKQLSKYVTPEKTLEEVGRHWQQHCRPWGSYLTHQLWALNNQESK
ncbi:DNA-3-methyladenine glycosylase 2 family protein [Shewanella sp. NIFS-20-20]|uniref:DNA-3-methyladenine glycosylase 2 family protein n=1 Tax=Shewanella sp. NIFS-20-20 TaxID=2853806 RepID=UPI001C45ED6A|nr:Ada metal-binding domain-containing protein [Shewanella sp. NIFS-20-20]MBV7314971.1 helix-turn-helix domain-containing protein [Shewanella sp. NIFS-20-20]